MISLRKLTQRVFAFWNGRVVLEKPTPNKGQNGWPSCFPSDFHLNPVKFILFLSL